MRHFIRQSIVIIIFFSIIGIGLFYSHRHGTAVYSGGQGTARDPYRIAKATDLIALGNEPQDYDKHFILAASIDLTGYTFDRALIAPDEDDRDERYQGQGFSGSFNGNGLTIRCLQIAGSDYAALFGGVKREAAIVDLGLEAVDVKCTGYYVGGLVGYNEGHVSACYVTGRVTGIKGYVGGLVGYNRGHISNCYSTVAATGDDYIGSLVGENAGLISSSYSTGAVIGDRYIGGLVGYNYYGSIWNCLWDMNTSGRMYSDGGVGLSTSEMMDPQWIGLQGWGHNPNWILDPHQDYPRLAWQFSAGTMVPEPQIDWITGRGTAEDPYAVSHIGQLSLINRASLLWQGHFVLVDDLDMDGTTWARAVIPEFFGRFNGNGCCIRNLNINGTTYLGMFGRLAPGSVVTDLGLEAVAVNGTADYVGALAGRNSGHIQDCYSSGSIIGNSYVAGLVGENYEGRISDSSSTCVVTGDVHVAGLVGYNDGDIRKSYSLGTVFGSWYVGGLMGESVYGTVSHCYSASMVSGTGDYTAGLVGYNRGSLSHCYSTGKVTAAGSHVGGLVGWNGQGDIADCNTTCTVTVDGYTRIGPLVGTEGE